MSECLGNMAAGRTMISLIFLVLVVKILAFNLEPRIPIIKKGNDSTYFGFSVAEHLVNVTGKPISKLLVGVPLAPGEQPLNNISGGVYACPLTNYFNDCRRLNISVDNDVPTEGQYRNGQWLGVVVRSEPSSRGKVVACAHRFAKVSPSFWWLYGICYSLSNSLDYSETYEPCLGKPVNKGHEEFGVCQTGSSLALSEEGEMLIGSPGALTWRGMLSGNSLNSGIDADHRWHSTPSRADDSPVDKYSYLGFSLITGKFFPNAMGYATGAPRGGGSGQVIIFQKINISTTYIVKVILTGDMFASSFGYEVGSADLNNDGLSDLIVGAPFYFDKEHGGAIYAYINKKGGMNQTNMNTPIKILGKKESRFGISITNLGDLNKDGYQDIAVGAPYEENGAVYIFHGTMNGINVEPSQIIKASDLPQQYLRGLNTFGYSLSGGKDMDDNGYPDLLVGAFNSDIMLLLRSRPVINILTEVQDLPKHVDPLKKRCFDGLANTLCFTFRACFKFNSSSEHQLHSTINMNYRIEAETFHTKRPSRVYFKNEINNGKTPSFHQANFIQNLSLLDFKCMTENLYFKQNTTDFLNPIKFKMTFTIRQNEPQMPRIGEAKLPDMGSFPILNQNEASKVFQVEFKKNCGSDDICMSNLILTASYNLSKDVDNHYYFSLINKEVYLEAILENQSNESAYETFIYVDYPHDVTFVEQSQEGKQYEVELYESTLKFSMGNPFQAGDRAVILMRFRVTDLPPGEKFLRIVLQANTTSVEPIEKKPIIAEAKIVVNAEISITSFSNPSAVFYGGKLEGESVIKKEDQIGPDFQFTYTVRNEGPENIDSFQVLIKWPYEVATSPKYQYGKWLLYLISNPVVDGFGDCRMSSNQVNPLGIEENITASQKINEKRSIIQNLENERHINQRRKREEVVVIPEKILVNNKLKTIVVLECGRGTARCFEFACTFKDLARGSSANIKIRARLWKATLIEDYPRVDSVRIYSNASILIDSSREVLQSLSNDRTAAMIEAFSEVSVIEPEGPPLWVIILSVLAGILLVALIVFCLWKLGFFKRNKPEALVANKNKDYMHDHADL